VINNDRIAGNGFCLPAGPLRESADRLETIDIIVSRDLNSKITDSYLELLPGDCARLDNPAMRLPLSAFWKTPVHAVAGIGNPQSFFTILQMAGIEVIPHAFPDHHSFTPADISFGDTLPVLMTSKDAVKCADFAGRNCWALTVSADVDAGILDTILQKIREKQANG
jgi:tetraacyldisaccharide 4'-kinase